jgi:hypothetical protein
MNTILDGVSLAWWAAIGYHSFPSISRSDNSVGYQYVQLSIWKSREDQATIVKSRIQRRNNFVLGLNAAEIYTGCRML